MTMRSVTHPASLPIPRTPLVGRERAVAAVAGLMRQGTRLVTLTGPGGTGKTRLAVQVATERSDAFADGVWFISLAPVREPDLVAATIAQTLGVRETAEMPIRESLIMFLRARHALLVLDNFEQVAGAAPLVSDLLASCPALSVLVTSRSPLHLYGEHAYAVAPLDVPDPVQLPLTEHLLAVEAIRLFVDRAQAATSGFVLTDENAVAVAGICVRLDGLPLAIELAAARIRVLPPYALLAQLARRLPVLVGGPRDVPARQQTLRNSIAWSYELLTPEDQRLFRQLSIFVGGWTFDAAEQVCSPDHDVLSGLERLVDHSLVQQHEQPDGAARFSMLETIREFGLELLATTGEADVAQRRYVRHFLQRADPAGEIGIATDTALRLRVDDDIHFEPDVANLRAALDWAMEQTSTEPKLLDTLLRAYAYTLSLWRRHGRLAEGRRRIDGVLAASPSTPTVSRALALNAAGFLAVEHGDFSRARDFHAQARTLAEALSDNRIGALTSLGLGRLALWQGDLTQAGADFQDAIDMMRPLGMTIWLLNALENLGGVVLNHDPQQAIALLEEALALNDPTFGASSSGVLLILGWAYLALGDWNRARTALLASLDGFQPQGASRIFAECLQAVAHLALAGQQAERAVRLLGFASQLRTSLETPLMFGDHAELEDVLVRARAQLGTAEWQTAWERGGAMTLSQAIDEARSVSIDEPAPTQSQSVPGGLSKREREVLRLVADGQSNQEIAADLFISPHTAANHVASILNKLGVDSRAAAAAVAIRQGII